MNTLLPCLPTIGHILIGLYFTFFGIWNIYHWKPTIDVMLADRIPSPLLLLSIGISWQIILGVMIMCNIYVKLAALMLIPFTLVSIFMFHPFWKYTGEKRKLHFSTFITNLTVTMGTLIVLLNTVTPLSNISDLLLSSSI